MNLPTTLIQSHRDKRQAHKNLRLSKSRKEIKQATLEFEKARDIYHVELFNFTGIDNQEFYNQTIDALNENSL